MTTATATTTQMRTTRIFKETLQAWVGGKRRCLHEGGTRSSKTWSILQVLVLIAQEALEPILISITSESLPHLKRGAIRDFFKILDESTENNPYYNKTENIYSKPSWKGTIEFFGSDDWKRVSGLTRDILFINEGNNVPWETARGLDVRTTKFTIVDWNPVSEFWVHQYESEPGKMIPGWISSPENAYVHSTYLDALDVLPQEVVDNIESNKNDPNFWSIYGLGILGKITGLVHPFDPDTWQVDALPDGDYFFGLDFGFTDDPAVLVKNVIVGDALYSQELFYEHGLTNDQIARKMDLCGVKRNYDEIYADSAEPKSIQEIADAGFNIKPCEKGQGSVEYGIQKVNQYRQHWTKDSLNCIKEQRNFRYIQDKDGKFTEKTTHKWSHGMDARRYAVSSHIVAVGGSGKIKVQSQYGGRPTIYVR